MVTYQNIGVVITRFGESRYELHQAVKSVLNNGINKQSIIVINDNISDPLIPEDVLNSNLINNNTRNGVSHSRNTGIKFFNDKEWIAFLDADDAWVDLKILSQIDEINKNSNINIISTGMIEKSWFGDLVRIPDIRELKSGGNPCYLSSILVRNTKKVFFDNLPIEDRAFVRHFSANEIYIIKKPLIKKFNYKHRRGVNIIASFNKKGGASNIKFNKLKIILFKFLSIRKININFSRIVFYLLSKLSGNISTQSKRISLSLNILSSEYRNLKHFSIRFNIPMYSSYFFLLPVTTRNRWLLESNNFKQSLIAYICGGLELSRYIYVGLPGARLINEIIDLMPHKKFIHVCHGKPSSYKFYKKTYGSIFENVKYRINSKHTKLLKNNLTFLYDENINVWIHGFQKRKSYSFLNLLNDLKILNKINKKALIIYPHPSAWLFKFYLFCTFYNAKNIKKYNSDIIYANKIYISSPSLLSYLESIKIDHRLSIINLRKIND